jgi:hypothetical protein
MDVKKERGQTQTKAHTSRRNRGSRIGGRRPRFLRTGLFPRATGLRPTWRTRRRCCCCCFCCCCCGACPAGPSPLWRRRGGGSEAGMDVTAVPADSGGGCAGSASSTSSSCSCLDRETSTPRLRCFMLDVCGAATGFLLACAVASLCAPWSSVAARFVWFDFVTCDQSDIESFQDLSDRLTCNARIFRTTRALPKKSEHFRL